MDNLPIKIDPIRLAMNASRVKGVLPIKNMRRLCASVASEKGEVDVSLTFGVNEQGIRFLKGRLATHLALQCQRCMELFDYKIESDFILGLVETEEEADELPDSFDPLVVKDNELIIQDVVEDELIVSLPIVSMHELTDCKVTLPFKAESDNIHNNPFKVIELLRNQRDKK